jgi:hypothetical protein
MGIVRLEVVEWPLKAKKTARNGKSRACSHETFARTDQTGDTSVVFSIRRLDRLCNKSDNAYIISIIDITQRIYTVR